MCARYNSPCRTTTDPPPISVFRTHWPRFRAYLPETLVGLLFLLACNALGMLIPVRVQQVIDGLGHASTGALGPLLGQMLLLGVGLFVTRLMSRIFLVGVGRKLECGFREAMFERLLTLSATYHQRYTPGELLSRVTNDAQALRYLTGGGIMLGFNTLFAYAMALPVMWGYSPRLTLLALSLFPLAVFLMRGVNQRVKALYGEVQGHLADISTVASENLGAMAVIQAYAKEPVEARRFERVCRQYLTAFLALIRERVWLTLIMALVSSVGVLAVLAQGGAEVIGAQMSRGAFLAFLLLLERLSFPTASMGWVLNLIAQGGAAMTRIDAVLSARDPAQRLSREGRRVYESVFPHGPLSIRHLTFAYPGAGDAQNAPVLHDICLNAEPGDIIALVGPVGAGKSTLLSLIAGCYPVPEGSILIGGRDLNAAPVGHLRQTVARMPQRCFLFSGTIAQNIAYARPDTPLTACEQAARAAAMDAEITAMADGYATPVGERGLTLSGGQRQRLTLARTLLADARILLLDDPFANVDAQTEAAMLDALLARAQARNRITLVATHRLAITPRVSRVALLDAGRLLAVDSHEALLASQPLYRALHQLAQLESDLSQVWHDAAEATS